MSLNKSKAKTARKSSHNTNPAVADTELAAVLAATYAQSVPLSVLVSSPLNVRTTTYCGSSIRQLADSIKGVGLLQNLVVHALPAGNYGVAAGGVAGQPLPCWLKTAASRPTGPSPSKLCLITLPLPHRSLKTERVSTCTRPSR